MSSEISPIFRHQGVEFTGLLSSGMLQDVFYNPRLFAGDPEILAKVKGWQEEYPRHPSSGGIVVVDLDAKRRWDMQVARNLDLLSGSFDYSWRHYNELEELGWVCEGLYLTDGTYARPFKGSPREFEAASREAVSGVGDDFREYMARAVHIKIQAPGWTNLSWDIDEPRSRAAMLASLQEAGFVFSAAEVAGWKV